MKNRGFRFTVAYVAWSLLCGILFAGLRSAQDPARRPGRMLSDDAALRAVAVLKQTDSKRFATYEAVHIAYAGQGEAGATARWVVLCDRVPHTALRQAVVVELDAKEGTLLRVRAPKED